MGDEKLDNYILIKASSYEDARKKIRKLRGSKIIFSSDDDELSRKILEKEKIHVLLLNLGGRKDQPKQKNSGLNHILARIAKKGGVAIGIYLDEIIKAEPLEKSKIIARVIQNIKICNKAKLRMKFFIINEKFKRDAYDLKALGIVLGMPTWMTKDVI